MLQAVGILLPMYTVARPLQGQRRHLQGRRRMEMVVASARPALVDGNGSGIYVEGPNVSRKYSPQ